MASLPPSFPGMPEFPPGEVWLTGAGPGDPRLLTLLAVHALGQADDVVHDALVDARILDLARADVVRHFAGKRGGRPSHQQADINDLLIDLARRGRRVLRLKGGDPFVFGRGGEEASALVRAGVRFRVIPGVTAGLAAMALAAIPATTRDTNHAVILAAGHRAADGGADVDWEKLAATGQPLVLYMPMAQLADIVAALQRGGLSPATPVALIEAATTPREKFVETDLAHVCETAATNAIRSPALVVVGEIVALRRDLLAHMGGWS